MRDVINVQPNLVRAAVAQQQQDVSRGDIHYERLAIVVTRNVKSVYPTPYRDAASQLQAATLTNIIKVPLVIVIRVLDVQSARHGVSSYLFGVEARKSPVNYVYKGLVGLKYLLIAAEDFN